MGNVFDDLTKIKVICPAEIVGRNRAYRQSVPLSELVQNMHKFNFHHACRCMKCNVTTLGSSSESDENTLRKGTFQCIVAAG